MAQLKSYNRGARCYLLEKNLGMTSRDKSIYLLKLHIPPKILAFLKSVRRVVHGVERARERQRSLEG